MESCVMHAFIELIELIAALTLTTAGIALVAGLAGAARTLLRYGLAFLLLAFLLPTLLGLIQYGVGRTREMLPTFPQTSALGWCAGSVVCLGHVTFGAWYLTRERRALAQRTASEETRRARTRERERLPPPIEPGASS